MSLIQVKKLEDIAEGAWIDMKKGQSIEVQTYDVRKGYWCGTIIIEGPQRLIFTRERDTSTPNWVYSLMTQKPQCFAITREKDIEALLTPPKPPMPELFAYECDDEDTKYPIDLEALKRDGTARAGRYEFTLEFFTWVIDNCVRVLKTEKDERIHIAGPDDDYDSSLPHIHVGCLDFVEDELTEAAKYLGLDLSPIVINRRS